MESESINVLRRKDDKYPMLTVAEERDLAGALYYGHGTKSFNMVLELLAACGMILGARLRSSLAVGRCHRPLSSSVHYSFSHLCERLEPFWKIVRLIVLNIEQEQKKKES